MTNNDTELKPDEVRIDIIKGVEGLAIYINDYRICGPKPWGGGEMVKIGTYRFAVILVFLIGIFVGYGIWG